MKYKNVVIIQHPSGQNFNSYDILIKNNESSLISSDQGYKLNCRFVEEYIKKNPKMVYLFSEDNGHIPHFNWIVKYVNELIDEGAKLLIVSNIEELNNTQTKKKVIGEVYNLNNEKLDEFTNTKDGE